MSASEASFRGHVINLFPLQVLGGALYIHHDPDLALPSVSGLKSQRLTCHFFYRLGTSLYIMRANCNDSLCGPRWVRVIRSLQGSHVF